MKKDENNPCIMAALPYDGWSKQNSMMPPLSQTPHSLSTMQIVMNVVIAGNGFAVMFWIFTKGVLNLVKAANEWVKYR